MLFDAEDAPQDGKDSKTDRCLDPGCFERKATAFLKRRKSEPRGEHPKLRLVQVGFDGIGDGVREKFGDRLTRVYAPTFVKASVKGAVPGMPVDGPKAGTLFHLDLGESVSVNGTGHKSARPRDAEGKPMLLSLPERRARLQKRRDAFLVNKVGESLRALTPEALTKTAASMGARTDTAAKRFDPLALVLAFGTSTRADREYDDGPWKRYDELLDRNKDLPVVAALHEVTQVWTRRLSGSDTHHVTEHATDAKRVCELLGLDAVAIEIEAAQTIATPKSWAAEPEHVEPAPKAAPTMSAPSPQVQVRSKKAASAVPPRRSAKRRSTSC